MQDVVVTLDRPERHDPPMMLLNRVRGAWQREREGATQTIHTGHLDLFRNFDERTGEPLPRMNTLLIVTCH